MSKIRLLPFVFSSLLIACSHSPASAPAPGDHASQVSVEKASSEPGQGKTAVPEPKQEVVASKPVEKQEDSSAVSKPEQTEKPSAAKPGVVQKGNATDAAPPAPVAPAPNPPTKEEPANPAPAQTVTLSVTGDKQHGVILSATSVAVQNGDTVLDVLSRMMKGHKIQMEYSGMKATAYVSGIDNLYEFDDGPKSGWVFKVNGKGGERSAGAIEVQPGDTIEWLYTLDLGKDVGVK